MNHDFYALPHFYRLLFLYLEPGVHKVHVDMTSALLSLELGLSFHTLACAFDMVLSRCCLVLSWIGCPYVRFTHCIPGR
jgi:hypothetical protein